MLFKGSFNIETIEFCGKVIGFELTFTMGKPFATQDCKTITHAFKANEQFTIIDESDDIGYIYQVLMIHRGNTDAPIPIPSSSRLTRFLS